MSFFGVGSNPLSTPVGMKIEKATLESLPSEDWGLNMEICDIINHSEEGPKDALKAIRKRLAVQPKNYTIITYTLTVLETCVKNCGKRFHILVCCKDFIQELVKLIGPKNDPPSTIQEKVLSLIQSWAEAFRHYPELSGVSQVYADLKHKGVEFPPSNPEADTPIFTPKSLSSSPPNRPSVITRDVVDGPGHAESSISNDQKAKLNGELQIVESNAKVLGEMLNELSPGKEEPDDLQLLKDLNATCRAMQERVVDLLGQVDDDLLTADILRINDDLNNVFVRYERHVSKSGRGKEAATRTVTAEVSPVPEDAALIDLGTDSNPVPQMAHIGLGSRSEDVDFDSFIQSRKGPDGAAAASDSNSPAITDSGAKGDNASDFSEMERWLQNKSDSGDNSANAVSSSEFDRFLAERAAIADNLPSIPAAVGSVPAVTKSDDGDKPGPRPAL